MTRYLPAPSGAGSLFWCLERVDDIDGMRLGNPDRHFLCLRFGTYPCTDELSEQDHDTVITQGFSSFDFYDYMCISRIPVVFVKIILQLRKAIIQNQKYISKSVV